MEDGYSVTAKVGGRGSPGFKYACNSIIAAASGEQQQTQYQ